MEALRKLLGSQKKKKKIIATTVNDTVLYWVFVVLDRLALNSLGAGSASAS